MTKLKGPTAHWHDDDGDEWVSPETAPDSYIDYWTKNNTIELIRSSAEAAIERVNRGFLSHTVRDVCVSELKAMLAAAASRGDMHTVGLLLEQILTISSK